MTRVAPRSTLHSGWGDGSYPVWIGRTAAGDIACFVADLLTFDIMTPIRPHA